MRTCDVAVVGAGPAGCAAALRVLQLHPGAEVVLLDAAAFPRDKTCGDAVAPQAYALLDALGAPGPPAPGVPRLRFRSPSGRVAERTCREPNRVVRRAVFDATLVAGAVHRGAELRRRRVRTVDVRADRVVLDGTLAARVVVGADGANSVVRRALGAPPTPAASTAVAVRGYTPGTPDAGTMAIEFAAGPVPGYAWSFPLAGGGANVGYGVFDRRAAGSRRDLVAALHRLLPGQEPDPATVRGHHLPLSTAPRWHPDGRVLLAGDAAATVNPLTGEGIFDALASGALAGGAALGDGDPGRRHRRAMRRCFGRHHRHTAAMAALLARPRLLDAAVTAAARHAPVFDAAVELGQARGAVPAVALARVLATLVTG
jgi:menaquinone-9 beta-reductase